MIEVSGDTAQLVERLPEIAPEVVAEWNVAQWLNAELAPKGNPLYDVWRSPMFPGITFQVKLSTLFSANGKAGGRRSAAWRWWDASRHDAELPHIYVLCGLTETGANWFVVPKRIFDRHATKTTHSSRSRGAVIVQARTSHESWIWNHYCSNPEKFLVRRVQEQMDSGLMLLPNHSFHLTAAPVELAGLWDDSGAAAGEAKR